MFAESVWGEAYAAEGGIAFGFPRPQDDVWPYLGGYIALRKYPRGLCAWPSLTPHNPEVITAAITILSQLPSIYGALRASRELYRTMLLSVIRFVLYPCDGDVCLTRYCRAPSRWFDKTPSVCGAHEN